MVFYMPFDMIDGKGWLAHDANILSSTKWVDIIEHALEVLQWEMGIMKIQLWKVTLDLNALHDKLATCQTKSLGLLQEAFTMAIGVGKKC
jgi:hypothetical protein